MDIHEHSQGNLLVLWAKTSRDRANPEAYHPVLCHLLDVAAVTLTMWQAVVPPSTRRAIAAALGMDEDAAGQWVAFCAGLHDLGKASPTFQLIVEPTRPRLQSIGLPCPSQPPKVPHGAITTDTLPRILEDDFGLAPRVASRIGTSIGGHHGIFPKGDELSGDAVGRGPWVRIRSDLVQSVATALDLPREQRPIRIDNATAMWLAGLVSVADWIGSIDDYFPYAISNPVALPEIDPVRYLHASLDNARAALKSLGWLGWSPPREQRTFRNLFPFITETVPLQDEIVALACGLKEPGLVIMEAPMGEGKTEAALYLADHWSVVLGQRGCYVALPTQATSNQMFGRVERFLSGRYPADVVNLQLLHGHAALSAEFEELRRNGNRVFTPQGIYGDHGTDSAQARVVAAEWFTYRKRGLLAPFGVGTVDQALLAALQTRHVFVRLFALARKTVIIDEVHAYDTYMSTLLERLLEWLGALGTSVILLSATLPKARREALTAAYRRGAGHLQTGDLPAVSYPRITWATTQTADARHVAVSSQRARTIRLDWVDGRVPGERSEPFVLGQRLKEKLIYDGCVAVICNTVRQAQQVYAALKAYFPGTADDGWPELDLLHARYLFDARDQREKRVLTRFGKPDAEVDWGEGDIRKVRRPHRAVLVATQIIEQSLDLDFDLMVTEVAPIDLVLQRMGRLHRHERPRPSGLTAPTLWLCQPEAVDDGVPEFGRGNEVVYNRHTLLRSWLALRNLELHGNFAITIPDDIEELIKAVYDDERLCPESLSVQLRRQWEETRKDLRDAIEADRQQAVHRDIEAPDFDGALWRFTHNPREEDDPDLHPAHQALTRLTEQTVSVVCLYEAPQGLAFDPLGREKVPLQKPSIETTKRLLRHSMTISARSVVFRLLEQSPPREWQDSPLLRHHRLIILDQQHRAPIGSYTLCLDDELGLVISKTDKEV